MPRRSADCLSRSIVLATAALLAAALTPGGASLSRAATPRTRTPAPPPPAEAPKKTNPLLPPQIAVESLFPDLSLVQKTEPTPPPNVEPLFSPDDWQKYRAAFGTEADLLPRQKSSGLIAFSQKLIAAANAAASDPTTAGYQRLLLLRAAISCFRTRDGFTTANKAVIAYEKVMDVQSPAQVAALWTLANAMSRTVATPRPDRVHYSGIAAKANMQLTLLMLDTDQVDAAQSLTRMVGYHEGWLKTSGATPADRALRPEIAQVRTLVRQTTTTMDYLATQYEPAINGNDSALMAIYLYGRYVKGKPAIVADLPAHKPGSPLASLAAALAAAERGDPNAMYNAAETLRVVAGNLPDGVLKQRTLYAALLQYRAFIADPHTERDRVKRTLARMATESVVADGARGPSPIVTPFAAPIPTTAPAPTSQPTVTTLPATRPATPPAAPSPRSTITTDSSTPTMPEPVAPTPPPAQPH